MIMIYTQAKLNCSTSVPLMRPRAFQFDLQLQLRRLGCTVSNVHVGVYGTPCCSCTCHEQRSKTACLKLPMGLPI